MSSDSQPRRGVSIEMIEAQLRRIEASAQFIHSRRYPRFLNYVVHKALQGKQDELKERTIGVEAFGRLPDYDLNADPIVRITAGEVRKRLAQYYYESGHKPEWRIELHPGSYVPEFKYITDEAEYRHETTAEELAGAGEQGPATHEPGAGEPRRRIRFLLSGGALLVLAVAAAAGVYLWQGGNSAYDRFWQPVLDNPGPVLIAVGSVTAMQDHAQTPQTNSQLASSVGGHPLSSDPVAMADTVSVSRFLHVLFGRSKQSTIQSSTDTSFSDLQKGPVILVSGFNNPWTMRLTDSLHYHFVRSGPDDFEIVDHQSPARERWAVNTLTPFTGMARDYGLVARFHDPTTDQVIVVAAGIGEDGTLAASELLSSKSYMGELSAEGKLPRRYKNIEAVIETETIGGKPGPPHILAVYTW